jgi:hypothetical protein
MVTGITVRSSKTKGPENACEKKQAQNAPQFCIMMKPYERRTANADRSAKIN